MGSITLRVMSDSLLLFKCFFYTFTHPYHDTRFEVYLFLNEREFMFSKVANASRLLITSYQRHVIQQTLSIYFITEEMIGIILNYGRISWLELLLHSLNLLYSFGSNCLWNTQNSIIDSDGRARLMWRSEACPTKNADPVT